MIGRPRAQPNLAPPLTRALGQATVCDGVQLNDWGSGLTTAYPLRNLPDDPVNPDLLVATRCPATAGWRWICRE